MDYGKKYEGRPVIRLIGPLVMGNAKKSLQYMYHTVLVPVL